MGKYKVIIGNRAYYFNDYWDAIEAFRLCLERSPSLVKLQEMDTNGVYRSIGLFSDSYTVLEDAIKEANNG